MADATWAIPNFLGGEISDLAQGRFDKPDYRVSLNVCVNAFPIEIGTWTRRPGTRFAGTTRRGAPGRVVKFDFEQDYAVTLEFTDGFVRFREGPRLIAGNDPRGVIAISTANPAVVQTVNHGWSTDDIIIFNTNIPEPLLQRREFLITVVDPDHFSLRDAITGANVSGAGFVSVANSVMYRLQELATPFVSNTWADLRAVQASTTDILLSPTIAPQALTVEQLPVPSYEPEFAIAAAIFNDGPYLDPFINGVQATPSAKSGIISLSLAFPAWSATKAYAKDAFVTDTGVNYVSLRAQNVNHAPAGGAPYWATTSAGAAINDGRGFLGTDIGRLVRLFSEPAEWDAATAYAASTAAAPVVVSYNPSGEAGATVYYEALVASTGKVPGTDTTNWGIVTNAAVWSWGRITSLTNVIDRTIGANIGDMIQGGGLAAAFDGVFSQTAAASALLTNSGGAVVGNPIFTLTGYVGKNYTAATDQVVQQATVWPSSDSGHAAGTYNGPNGSGTPFAPTVVFNLYGKASAPSSSSDGTLLGTSGILTDMAAPVTVVSTDQVTAWKYVWVQQVSQFQVGGSSGAISYNYFAAVSELELFNPTGTGTASGVNVEILGPPLLYTNPIITWRLGVYSDTTGWPTCGTYDDGRLWLGGAIKNRFDASVSNGVLGATVNFAPTDQYGAVAANNAISYTLNAKDTNQIVWMSPEEGGIVMGTQAGEWLVRAPTTGPIAPANISARRITKVGAANVEPVHTEHTNIFIHRYRAKLTEYFPDAYSGKFTGPNLADKAAHISNAGIAEVNYTSSVTPVIWGRDDAGALFGVTYKRDRMTTSEPPTYYAWHRHELGSGRVVESLCAGPSIHGDLDTLTMVTNAAATSVRHVELLTDTPDENAELANAWFLDDAVTPTATTEITVSVGFPYGGIQLHGLWHLNGSVVQVFAGGLDCGEGEGGIISDFFVSNGSLSIQYGDGLSWGPGRGLFTAEFFATLSLPQIVIGFTYNSDGQIVRPVAPDATGARNGPALNKTRRTHRYGVLVSNTRGISFGSTLDATTLKPADFRKANGNPIDALTTFSGVHTDTLNDDYSYNGMVSWRVSRPWPANVVALTGNIQTQDR